MIAFPSMLSGAAIEAGMKVPPDEDNFENYKEEFPHFYVYAMLQLGAPMPYPGVHGENAKVIAEIPEDKIRLIDYDELLELGFQTGYPIP